ncbi:MAG: hypothetical protein E6K78_07210 [Candidatus Eisenbacteria bacterium]|uniref:DUF4292 domain-containing protein n=1 Tax=Eiseniibacteriota bacterium TaxID=2212470 RepID=A0A538TQ95_UNCEI|nr:MAG: hypothetical protein E6K78_07210 [Candidatus Eisenbacteria bacterium]
MIGLGSSRRWAAAGCAAILAVLSSCAPHRVSLPEVSPASLAERYRLALAERLERGGAMESEVVLWAEVAGQRRWPGIQADVYAAAPDAVRLKVGSTFGTAAILGARGDSLRAYLPAERLGLRLDASRDSLPIAGVGALAYRALSAAWRPPAEAWQRASRVDSLLEVDWMEEGDSLALRVGRAGLPVQVSGVHQEVRWRADYRGWDRSSGIAWPSWVEFTQGSLHLKCKVTRSRWQARADTLRLAVRIPAGADALTLDDLRAALRRLGSF